MNKSFIDFTLNFIVPSVEWLTTSHLGNLQVKEIELISFKRESTHGQARPTFLGAFHILQSQQKNLKYSTMSTSAWV